MHECTFKILTQLCNHNKIEKPKKKKKNRNLIYYHNQSNVYGKHTLQFHSNNERNHHYLNHLTI